MSIIYSMSDIHGHYKEMQKSLEVIDLDSNSENLLLFLGDYVDGGIDSYKVLDHIMKLQKKYHKQVIVLLGNHDEAFLNWLNLMDNNINEYPTSDDMRTIKSFFTEEELESIIRVSKTLARDGDFLGTFIFEINYRLRTREKFKPLVSWLREKEKEKRYYTTDSQIYVHAGIDEEAEDLWEVGTPDFIFTNKYPATLGDFYKDIISGHIHTNEVSKDTSNCGKVFWDKQSHFFIDGNTRKSGIVPILKYDSRNNSYSSFTLQDDNSWKEYSIKK